MKPTKHRSLTALRREAATSARWRGHSLRWQTFNPDSALGICRCGMQVLVLRKPSPNQIDIGGEAVAVSCPLKAA